MPANDFILIGESTFSEFSTTLEQTVTSWSQQWLGIPASVIVRKYQETDDDWETLHPVSLTGWDNALYTSGHYSSADIVLSPYFDKYNGADSYSSYVMNSAMAALCFSVSELPFIASVGASFSDMKSLYSGYLVVFISIQSTTFRLVCKPRIIQEDKGSGSHIKKLDLAIKESIDIRIFFNPTKLSLAELISVKPGDVIEMGHLVDAPLQIFFGSTVIGKCTPGNSAGYLAVKILGENYE